MNKLIHGLILDMDGVLWRGPQPIGDLPENFSRIKQSGLKVVLATNNAGRTPTQHLQHIANFGVTGLEDWQIINSAQAAVDLLLKLFPAGGPVYVVGEPPLVETMENAGFEISDEKSLAVVAGIDRTFNYTKLAAAQKLILGGAVFMATNTDRTFPIPGGVAPGAGSIIAAIQAATDIEPTVAGKPSPGMYEIALKRMALKPNEVLVVGDRLETDIVGAQALGCRTTLVLSGVSTPRQAADWLPAPDYILPSLADVLDMLGI